MSRHHSHPEIVVRLKRIQGHVAKVVSMIESQTPCVEIAQQLQAVESALTNAKRVFVEDHIAHCFDEKNLKHPQERRHAIEEFKSITKYL